MPLSTKELISNIPREPDTKNARYVYVFSKRNLGPASYLYTTITKIPGDFTRKHKVWIRDQEGKDVMSSKNIWVSCDCERFCFAWEHALFKRGASSIRYSNGEPSKVINKAHNPAGCKHVYRCLADIAKKNRKKFTTRSPSPVPVKKTSPAKK